MADQQPVARSAPRSNPAPPCATYDRLREAALTLFCTRGYQATSLRDLARIVGIQAGSLYNHIESKQALLFELMEVALECLLADTRRALRGDHRPGRGLQRFVLACVNNHLQHARSLQLIERESGNLTLAQQTRIDHLRHEHHQCLQEVVQGLLDGSNCPPAQLMVLTHAILGMIKGVIPLLEQQAPAADVTAITPLLKIIYAAVDTSIRA